jgi:putative ABC transport system permease protein
MAEWRVVKGRAPAGADEVVIGSLGAAHDRLDMGDSIELGRADASAPPTAFRIVGIATISALDNGEFGQIVWVHPDAAQALGLPQQPSEYLLLTAKSGLDADTVMRSLGLDPDAGRPIRPVSVGDLREVGSAPWMFAAVLALLIAAALAQMLVASVGAQRRDTAVLRTLGFVRGQVYAAVRWQASTAITAGLVVGLPLGVAAGAVAWRRIATNLGVDARPDVAVLWLVAVSVAALVVANLVAWWPAHLSGRVHTAQTLRSE